MLPPLSTICVAPWRSSTAVIDGADNEPTSRPARLPLFNISTNSPASVTRCVALLPLSFEFI
ncbi:hypothetical protein D3C71_1351410 [compost metagenome]